MTLKEAQDFLAWYTSARATTLKDDDTATIAWPIVWKHDREQEEAEAEDDYLLFTGLLYYPSGGAEDFVLRGTLQECLAHMQRFGADWANLINLTTTERLDLQCDDGVWSVTTQPQDPV